jgi:tRNA1(Val) A37 N6-methylase TrmN6
LNTADVDTVRSDYLGGKLTLLQPARGYRAAIDPALLAASLCLKPGARAVEFGCGVGAALLSAALLNPEVTFLGLEQDQAAAALAERNVALNGLSDQISIRRGDLAAKLVEAPVDAVFFNPPFFDDPKSLRAPAPDKTAAWINDSSLGDWIALALRRLKEGGGITLIQRADRLADILVALEPKAGGIRVLPVYPRAGAPAKRVIVAAIKTSNAPLQILPGLVLHESDGGAYMPDIDALLRGDAVTALAQR